MMDRPLYLGIMGGPKVGKTHFAGSLFESAYVDAQRVLYYDNHGSTDPFPFHQWTTQEPWRVKHIDPSNPGALYKDILDLRRTKWSKNQYPYDAIVVDDWSEFAQADIEDRLEDEDNSKMIRHWGDHGDVMRSAARLLHPRATKAHHIAIFQASQLPDPLEKRPKIVEGGRVRFTEDTRETKLRPFLQGGFAAWFPYKLDAVFYQEMEEKRGIYKFQLQLAPTDKVAVLTRWLHRWHDDPRMSKYMENATFDKILEMIQSNVLDGQELQEEEEKN